MPLRWRKLENFKLELPRDTLLSVEVVQELKGEVRGQRSSHRKSENVKRNCVLLIKSKQFVANAVDLVLRAKHSAE